MNLVMQLVNCKSHEFVNRVLNMIVFQDTRGCLLSKPVLVFALNFPFVLGHSLPTDL